MARSRNIKPALFSNDELAENDPLGRLLFIGMWTIADCSGNLVWREKRIKAQILPYDNCDIKKLAINLDNSGFIRFYSDGDNLMVNIVNFSKHQNPHKNEREKGSDVPKFVDTNRESIDMTTLTINRDKSGLKRNDSTSDRADSLNLIPDSSILIPDYIETEKESKKELAEAKPKKADLDWSEIRLTDEQKDDIKGIRVAAKAKLTQRSLNTIIKELEKAKMAGIGYEESIDIWAIRGWKAFTAEWAINHKGINNGQQSGSKATLSNLGDTDF